MRKPKDAQEAVIMVASKVCTFLEKMDREHRDRCERANVDMPEDDFIYGEALLLWETHGRREGDIFSTDDAFMLEFKKELTEEFGLPVMTREEAKEVEKQRKFRTLKVTGIPEQTKLMN